ncbi:MAG: hypothetical protein JSR62_08600 [Nitrospira sp.]|nr:hypothetical protein [Nitrospira sp.]
MAYRLLLLILSVGIIFPVHTWATESRPFWTEQALFHFGDDVFFTGRSSCAPSIEEGRQRAYLAAMQEVRNFTRAKDIEGFPIDTQMIFEDSHPADCAQGSVTVWRLLRAPRAALESLSKRASPGRSADVSPIVAHVAAIRNLTPRVGMLRDEVWNRYGLPRSIWARPEQGELIWDYAQFGLTIVFNQDDVLTRWRLTGPHPRSSDERMVPVPPESPAGTELPTVDLTSRLQQLEEQQDQERRRAAQRYCSLRFADVPDTLRPQPGTCEQREYERLKEQHPRF